MVTPPFTRNLDIRPALDEFDVRHRIVLSVLTEIRQQGLAKVVYPHLALCDEARCRIESNGRTLYSDDNHLTRYGADSIRHIFEPVL